MKRPISPLPGALLGLALSLCACGGDDAATGGGGAESGSGSPADVPASVFVDTATSGALGVRAALAEAKAGADIVVRGKIGGRKGAFVDGRAMFVVIDEELTPCAPDEGCPTPWDYCCESKETLLANTLTVQVVDANGAPLAASLHGVHGLDELETVVVAGSVRSTEGTVVVDAKSIHVANQ